MIQCTAFLSFPTTFGQYAACADLRLALPSKVEKFLANLFEARPRICLFGILQHSSNVEQRADDMRYTYSWLAATQKQRQSQCRMHGLLAVNNVRLCSLGGVSQAMLQYSAAGRRITS